MILWKYCPECAKKLDTSGEYPTCPDGHFTKYPNPAPGNLCFIKYQNKYLLMRRNREPKKGWWVPPGGYIIYGETAEESVIREIKEETGIVTEKVDYLGTFFSRYGDEGEHTIVLGYTCEVDNDKVILSEENDEYKWVELDDIPEMAFKDCNDALEMLKKHNG